MTTDVPVNASPDLPYWLALARFPKFGAKSLARLSNSFPNMREAFHAPLSMLIACGIRPKAAQQFVETRSHINPDEEMELLARHKTQLITFKDETYPPALKHLYDPPAVLFVRGTLPPANAIHLAVVGSREHTSYGEAVIRLLIEPAAAQGVVIVSGLARGIDALAHRAALRAQTPTVAILGAGVDDASTYPAQNRALAQMILAQGGAIISEFPLKTQPRKEHFPIRNRLIAGLCRATMVVEAQEKSGSLITAGSALEIGRDVLAVPGPVTSPLSLGPNRLIKAGAIPITSLDDLYEQLGITPRTQPNSYQPENDIEACVLPHLTQEAIHVDDLIRLTKLSAPKILSTLTLLEMKNAARQVGNQYYVLG